MKICISSTGNSMESQMDPRFGRCEFFAIVDTETNETKLIDNAAAKSGGGAGIAAGQLMVDNDVEVLITGNVGPNANDVLKAAKIKIVRGKKVSLNENVEMFKKNELEVIDTTVPSHSGMK
ncbi:Predicted Fe-Mo cluster-binding protein, NifX family [Dethiosulfatibacter aminovorans DSM 17477]|uniref:Predicted Fe-Mo cluster-binding protein, NifX family n=1 Tax=Dethiosulfatibacter aminovorans DSM 17477 TaxID=1121476 RepID=A0A1M6IAL5_9FIRM|nr:NifB/NifX family molybdenum-iron cluster-binding protein [Dethiosulfatibacter aminovorans]SHJ31418.1 Predicted Fe-Mo cluster-binding protein, NifX family [Dethiosulfatibacter aminovorans DSM 17477]